MSQILTDAERSALMPTLREWTLVPERDAIHKRFAFKDFDQAFAFMTRVAAVAREMDHHPDWANRYRFVEVTLWTHAAGGLTRRDIDLAAAMDRIEQEIAPEPIP